MAEDGTMRADEERNLLDELIQRIRVAFTSGRLGEAVAMLDEADHLVLDERERLEFARIRAVTLSRAGDHVAALEALDGVADDWLDRGELLPAAGAASMAAYALHQLGRLDDALETAAAALSMLDTANTTTSDVAAERVLAATARNTLGPMFLELEAVGLAIGEFRAVIELTGDEDPILLGIVRANLASAFLRSAGRDRTADGASTGADADLDHAEALARALLDSDVGPRRRVEAASILAAVLLQRDRGEAAAQVLDEHAALEHLVTDPRALVDWSLLWARAHRARGHHDAARARAERAIELAAAAGDRIAVSMARRERSRVREAQGDLVGALEDLRAADDGARELRTGRFEALVEQLVHRARLERVAEDLDAERTRLVRAIETDPLTGLGNRRRLTTALTEVAGRGTDPTSVVMIDVDRFKSVNDGLGHGFGDRVLCDVATTIVGLARDADVVCRPGGDEFVMVLVGADQAAARAVTERIRAGVAALTWDPRGSRIPPRARHDDPRPDHAIEFSVSVSVGIASGPAEAVSELLAAADAALFDAKRSGRDRISVA